VKFGKKKLPQISQIGADGKTTEPRITRRTRIQLKSIRAFSRAFAAKSFDLRFLSKSEAMFFIRVHP